MKTRKDLANLPEPFDEDKNYQKFVRYGNAKLVSELKGYIAFIKYRNEKTKQKKKNKRRKNVTSYILQLLLLYFFLGIY